MGLFSYHKKLKLDKQDLADMEQVRQTLAQTKTKMPSYIVEAHEHCRNNRDEVNKSRLSGCFYCLQIFPSNDIEEWVDSGMSAICPKCGIDSVLGDAAGFKLTPEFLSTMHKYWF